MSDDLLPVPGPDRTPETDVFWSATAQGRLLLAHCDACGTVIWYPKALCPACGTTSISWVQASGRGSIYSYTVVHRTAGSFANAVPFVIAYVELEEGPRILTNIVGGDPAMVHIGQSVQVVFSDTGDGSSLYRFEPLDEP